MSRVALPDGRYRDVLRSADGGLLFDSGWRSNTIVDSCRVFLTRMMRFDFEHPLASDNGIVHLAVGRGEEAWDEETPPVDPAVQGLTNPYGTPIPVAALGIEYLDENGVATTEQTSRLQIRATLGTNYPAALPPFDDYPLREFGLFGSFDGDLYQINAIRHPVLRKKTTDTLVRTLRLYF